MIYISIDLETSGLDPENCQILEFGAIVEDTNKKLPFDELPKFKRLIFNEEIKGSPFAINMNSRIISVFADYQSLHEKFINGKVTEEGIMNFISENSITTIDKLASSFYNFLINNGFEDKKGSQIKINVAGKNFGMFDYKFLKLVPELEKLIKFNSRVLDPAILFVDWNNDKQLPSLNECKERNSIQGEVTHDAIEDAWDVIQVLRKSY